jgi:hypothetical protein
MNIILLSFINVMINIFFLIMGSCINRDVQTTAISILLNLTHAGSEAS